MKARNILMGVVLLVALFSFGCATGGHDYGDSQYYPGYYPPEYPYYDYNPFNPIYSNPSEQSGDDMKKK